MANNSDHYTHDMRASFEAGNPNRTSGKLPPWSPKHLHKVGDHCSYLDHHVLPEVRAMFAAMMSRVPQGGIAARYRQVVEKIADHDWTGNFFHDKGMETWRSLAPNFQSEHLTKGEKHLCDYIDGKLHPVIQRFFDKFVGEYGHGSIKELTGQPVVFIEGISWWLAYLSFDNPLVKGQEMSTRAVWRKDWPMASDAWAVAPEMGAMHALGLEIAQAEIAWWKDELRKGCADCGGRGTRVPREAGPEVCKTCEGTGKKYPWMDDPQAFRPAFDRARWALPGTISTGVAHTADVRTMGRVLKTIESFARFSDPSAVALLVEIKQCYREAMPGMAGMWLSEALDNREPEEERGSRSTVPAHLNFYHRGSATWEDYTQTVHYATDEKGGDVLMDVTWTQGKPVHGGPDRDAKGTYAEAIYNSIANVDIEIQCSLAAARDWHRHRTFMPWTLRVVRVPWEKRKLRHQHAEPNKGSPSSLLIQTEYKPQSDFAKQNVARYIKLCTRLFDHFIAEGNQWTAMCCLPLGTRVSLSGNAGLAHAIYMLELRSMTHGANFEYKAQAEAALGLLREQLPAWMVYDLMLGTEDEE